MSKDSQVKVPGLTSPFDAFSVPFGNAVTSYAQQFVKAAADWQKEVASFIELRVERDKQAVQSATKCADLPSLIKLQQTWAQEAASDYLGELRKLQDLTAQLGSAALTSAKALQPAA